jgi:hypothetical protein
MQPTSPHQMNANYMCVKFLPLAFSLIDLDLIIVKKKNNTTTETKKNNIFQTGISITTLPLAFALLAISAAVACIRKNFISLIPARYD